MRLDHLLFKKKEYLVFCVQYTVNFLLVLLSFPVLSKRQNSHGELAQLARASALQAEGQGFEPPILHFNAINHGILGQ